METIVLWMPLAVFIPFADKISDTFQNTQESEKHLT